MILEGKPYSAAWKRYQADRDLDALISGVAEKYATDPDYPGKLRAILAMREVGQALAASRGKPLLEVQQVLTRKESSGSCAAD